MRKLIAGNWKMHGVAADLEEVRAIAAAAGRLSSVDVALCVPATLIERAVRAVPGFAIGAQDVHCADKGAHTGCISTAMLTDAGASLAIVGHSERREAHCECDADVKAKAEAVLAAGLLTIVCVGESEVDRDTGRHFDVVQRQLVASLPTEVPAGELVVAYEPIWAIGTGKAATVDDIAAMHLRIRHSLVEGFAGPGAGGGNIRILYGGSVKASNAPKIFAIADVDGALVGGASLTAADFVPIIEAAARG